MIAQTTDRLVVGMRFKMSEVGILRRTLGSPGHADHKIIATDAIAAGVCAQEELHDAGPRLQSQVTTALTELWIARAIGQLQRWGILWRKVI